MFDGVFQPYTPSQDIQDKFADIAQNLGENNPFYEAENEIYRMADEMANLSLDGQFNINLEEYLEKELPIPPLPENVTSAMPNQSVITQGQNILNNNLQTNASGLTATEEAYLSDEEKLIRRRSRGTIV